MAGNNPEQFQQLLGQLFAAINNHEPTVLAKINALLEKIPEEPNLLHLAGLASADQNQLSDSNRLFFAVFVSTIGTTRGS